MQFAVCLLSCLLAIVLGKNHMCWTVDQIADEVIKQTDANRDGILSQEEFEIEFIRKWSLSNDTCLSFHEFTSNWMANYHDHHDTAHAFFTNLDLSKDGALCILDVAVQLLMYDTNPVDGEIQPEEFRVFLHAMHPDSHQNGGHGHGC